MAKDNIKANVVTAPTLFIGVGGTGCRIIKGVYDLCQPSEMENISFVCMDTNVNDLKEVSGKTGNYHTIQTSNTQTVGSYLDYDMDALNNWFPKNAVLYDKTVSEGAGQVRAISRLALNATIKTGKIQPLYDAVDELFRKTGKEMKQALRVVFATTACGGTGSGILLPLSMLVRDYVKSKYPNTSLVARALILLPETLDTVIKSNVEKDSQRRNAYATIKEINAFMMKGSGFFDVKDELKRFNDLHIDIPTVSGNELRRLSSLPLDFCFLMDGQDAEDSTLVSKNQYEEQASLALYEQSIGPMQKDAFSMEDNIIKEMSNPGNYGRNRFGGIGAGAIRYPFDSIADYIAFHWATDAIGGSEEAAKWMRYDNAYAIYHKDCIKKGLAKTEMDSHGVVYCDKMEKSNDSFSKDLRNVFLSNVDDQVKAYFTELIDHMNDIVASQNDIKSAHDKANHLETEIDYKGNSNLRGEASENLDCLRAYEEAVKTHAQKEAERAIASVFEDDSKTINAKYEYQITHVVRNKAGVVCHPNAIRYILYKIESQMEKYLDVAIEEVKDQAERLAIYAPNTAKEKEEVFDASFTRKTRESSIDELCSAEKVAGKNPTILEKIGGYEKLYDMLNDHFPSYFSAVKEWCKAITARETYKYGLAYINSLNKSFEKFYGTFSSKVERLDRDKETIVESLRFRKGDSIMNVCSTPDVLDEMVKAARGEGAKEALLESDLNGQIFDAIRSNTAFEHEMEISDTILEDKRIDIFDEIILNYFKRKVRSECSIIDMNVIQAIAMENRLKARAKNRKLIKKNNNEDEKTLVDSVNIDDNIHYIREKIAVGSRLSAPSIQRLNNEEAREINCIAYNKSLKDMRDYRISELIVNGTAVDTVSRYELHYFNALYNLTPDKLNKFASKRMAETRSRDAGLYHKAYRDYERNIGPDSTKNMMVSTHIDKRWDSIAVMPELDFDFQNTCIMRIYQALIYGLVHGAIKYVNMSASVEGKRLYRYENSQKRDEDLIVSNHTPCDEFYEILDALYISPAVVEDIAIIKKKKRERDETKHSNYINTTFAKELETFCIECCHEGKTSLFEIPIVYYNSLPNVNRYGSEIAALIDAVIKTFRDELGMWEHPDDAKFILCQILQEQFDLLIDNYRKYSGLRSNLKLKDNAVIATVFRKIKEVMCAAPEPDDYEGIIQAMEDKLSK